MNDFVLKTYDEINDIWGLPQNYKGIDIYPIKLIDTKYKNIFYRLFAYPKNYIPDKLILKMSYLKFILYVIQSMFPVDEYNIQEQLTLFLKYALKTEDVFIIWNIEDNPQNLEDLVLSIKIGDAFFDEWDFDNIREIVLQQNGLSIEYVEEYNPELEEKLNFENRKNSDVNFAEEIFSFCAVMKKTIYEIQDYTIYQFKKQLERINLLNEYELYKPLEASGQIKMKDGVEIRHYLSHIKKSGRYDSILINKDSYVEKSDIFKATESI